MTHTLRRRVAVNTVYVVTLEKKLEVVAMLKDSFQSYELQASSRLQTPLCPVLPAYKWSLTVHVGTKNGENLMIISAHEFSNSDRKPRENEKG